jgi:HSP20 family protein
MEGVMAKTEKKEVTKTAEGKVQPRGSDVLSPFDEMDRMFDRFFGRSWPRSFLRPLEADWSVPAPFEGRTPKVDVIERDKEVVVKAELPGVQKENVEISVTDHSLTLRATTREEKTEEKGEYHRRELSRGEFVRSLTLPADVDGSKAKATYKDGVLELVVPKIEVSKRHSVKID